MSQIVLINPRYPFGKDQIFLNGSWCIIAAVLTAMGHVVKMVDLNLGRLTDVAVQEALKAADLVGVTVTGSAYIPEMLMLVPEIRRVTDKPIMVGGQVVERLSVEEFDAIFFGQKGVKQIRSFDDLALLLGCNVADIPSAYVVPLEPVWRGMGEDRMKKYMQHEMTLVISQGCHFRCDFCAASKGQSEQFREVHHFESDLRYLAMLAQRFGIETLAFYASNLDFFQNPKEIRERLEVIGRIQQETGIRVRIRCLSCLTSFLKARDQIPDFGDLLQWAGLWCIGFGVDGADESVWVSQHKGQNSLSDFHVAFSVCAEMGIQSELLMVLGLPEDTLTTLGKSLVLSMRALMRWRNVMLRPYLAKPFVPGNKGWQTYQESVTRLLEDPSLFSNLDFCALGSPLTHPRFTHRWLSNLTYLALCSLTLVGKGCTSPLLPQGGQGVLSGIAKRVNQLMPFDR